MDHRTLALLIPVLALLIPVLAIVGTFSLKALKILRGDPVKGQGAGQDDEARMIQEMYQGLARMEERIEALETLLLDQKGKDRTK